ncbi:BQ2448_3393 [Microbotryum intermedium]|uniref:NudC domain-containing protein 1 n=1 Tax=Microbotryum intermedium TaxID=269621 RepID=A0A238FEU8_9BASI|nr:BQ2448_3393 [Microbotryum intermedium]
MRSTYEYDSFSFSTKRELLNPKFESYKLTSPPAGSTAVSFALPEPGLAVRTFPDHTRLSYHQVQHRARHNHLYAGLDGDAVYIDAAGRVLAIELDQYTQHAPKFHHLLTLPPPEASSTSSRDESEYAAATAISSCRWIVSSGDGRLFSIVIEKNDLNWKGAIEATYELRLYEHLDVDRATPFQLHAANEDASSSSIFALLSVAVKSARTRELLRPAGASFNSGTRLAPAPAPGAPARPGSTTVFEYICVCLDGTKQTGASVSMSLTPLWRATGDDLPHFVQFQPALQRYCIGSTAPIHRSLTTQERPEPALDSTESSTLDKGQWDRTGESLKALQNIDSCVLPPPFSWTQDSESVTIAFAIPSDVPTSSIKITFSRQFITLFVASTRASFQSPLTAPHGTTPRISHKKLWDVIDPHTSVWTFDREAEGRDSTYGILSLHLEKAHPGTRWPDVFSPTFLAAQLARPPVALSDHAQARIIELQDDDDGSNDGTREAEYELRLENVPETLDASELSGIVDGMEQWHRDFGKLHGGKGIIQDQGFGDGAPATLNGDEMDVEVDGEVGRPLVVTWIDCAWSPVPRIEHPHSTINFSLLSTGLPLTPSSSTADHCLDYLSRTGLVIKHDIDGALLVPPSCGDVKAIVWTHHSTFPALAFALATKMNSSFVAHVEDQAVLAFDSPFPLAVDSSATVSTRNVFVYRAPADVKDKTSQQMVLRLGEASDGALLGVIGNRRADGSAVSVIALCEQSLVVFRDLIR